MYKDKIEEFQNLMESGLDEVATGDEEVAADYFTDACFVANSIPDEKLRNELFTMYMIDPRDFGY